MRWEVELWGTVLSFSIGPVQYEEPADGAGERLYLADGTHAGPQEDPVFPNLDWGDDEERRRRAHPSVGKQSVDMGHGRRRQPREGEDHGTRFGFSGER